MALSSPLAHSNLNSQIDFLSHLGQRVNQDTRGRSAIDKVKLYFPEAQWLTAIIDRGSGSHKCARVSGSLAIFSPSAIIMSDPKLGSLLLRV